LQRHIVDLKYYVSDSSSDGYFKKFSLQSKPVNSSILAIDEKISKHPKDIDKYQKYFSEAISKMFNLFGEKPLPGQIQITTDFNTPSARENSHLGSKGSFSSLPSLPVSESSQLRVLQPKTRKIEDFWLNKNFMDYVKEKSILDGEQISDSEAGSSIYPIVIASDRETVVVQKSNSSAVRTIPSVIITENSISELDMEMSSVEKTPSPKSCAFQSPRSRAVAINKFVDEVAGAVHAQNIVSGTFVDTSSNAMIVSGESARRRIRTVKSGNRSKLTRTAKSKNAFLEGLGFSMDT